ncbi:hypothetical protein KA005_38160, partial [bacterium]|nr:hypothetical protein [bacterium]
GDKIIWEWETDQFELDFWIEDSKGDLYYEVFDCSSDSWSLVVPKDGKWTLKWENINLESLSYDYGIKLSFIATIEKGIPSDGGSTGPGVDEPDTDGDGVPDIDDVYPTDPNKWSSPVKESGGEDTLWVWGIVVILFIILIIAIVTFFLLKIKKK